MASYTKRQTKKRGIVWDVRFRAIVDGVEKQIKLSGFATKRDAVAAFNEWKAPVKATSSPLMFGSAVRAYVRARESVLATQSVYSIGLMFSRHITPYFEHRRVDSITRSDIVKWETDLWQKKNGDRLYRQSTLKSIYETFETFFKWVSETENIPNPFDGVKMLQRREEKREMSVWDGEQFKRFLSVEDSEIYRAFFSVLFYGGLREGEANALCAEDFTKSDGRYLVKISKSLSFKKGCGLIVTPPKNVYSNRVVSLPEHMTSMLDVFLSGKQGQIFKLSRCAVWTHFKTYTAKAGLPIIRVHDLRHSHASLLIAAGVPIPAVSKRLGHASVNITLSTYAHVIDKTDASTLAALDDL